MELVLLSQSWIVNEKRTQRFLLNTQTRNTLEKRKGKIVYICIEQTHTFKQTNKQTTIRTTTHNCTEHILNSYEIAN